MDVAHRILQRIQRRRPTRELESAGDQPGNSNAYGTTPIGVGVGMSGPPTPIGTKNGNNDLTYGYNDLLYELILNNQYINIFAVNQTRRPKPVNQRGLRDHPDWVQGWVGMSTGIQKIKRKGN